MNSIREHRESMIPKMTQMQLAEIICVSVDSIRRYEAGTREPRLSELKKMSEIFNCTIDDLVNPTQTPVG